MSTFLNFLLVGMFLSESSSNSTSTTGGWPTIARGDAVAYDSTTYEYNDYYYYSGTQALNKIGVLIGTVSLGFFLLITVLLAVYYIKIHPKHQQPTVVMIQTLSS